MNNKNNIFTVNENRNHWEYGAVTDPYIMKIK